MPPESASVPPPTLPFIVPLIRLCPFFRSPGFLPRVYLVPSPLITRRWATNPNTIINAVASVFIHASLELHSANSLFFETMLHARFVALSRLCSPFNLRAEREGVEGANESGIRWRVTENSIIPLSLSLSTTVLTPIACVSSAVRQICVTRKEGRGGVRDYHESHERTWLVKLNHHPSTRIRVRFRAVHSPSPLRDSSLFCLLSQVEKWSQVGR